MYEWYTAHTYILYIGSGLVTVHPAIGSIYFFWSTTKKKYLLAIGANSFVQKYGIPKSTGL